MTPLPDLLLKTVINSLLSQPEFVDISFAACK